MVSTTRRAILGAIACAPAAAILAAPLPKSGHSEWNAALAVYKDADRKFDAAWDRYNQIEDMAAAATPNRPDHLFDTLNLNMSMSRREAEAMLQFHMLNTVDQIDIAATLNELDAYRAAMEAARKSFNLADEQAAASALSEPLCLARDALMGIPAPDTAALLIKIEITSHCISDEHAEITLADARRLLVGEG